jgi:outer membrane biosynthesis protein TonB
MKQRATRKADISARAKQFDVRGTVLLEVLVGPDGNVICTHGAIGHPMLLHEIEAAVRQWAFTPLKESKKRVAYVGNFDFTLCNIGCASEELKMTLLK